MKAKHASPQNENTETQRLLPVPEVVIRHHGQTIFGPMKEWLAQKRVPPVLLLTGSAGIGKRTMGTFISQWIFCEKAGFTEAKTIEEEQGGFGLLGLMGDPAMSAPEPESEPAEKPAANGDPVPCGTCGNCQKALHGSWVDFTEVLPEDEESDTLKIDQFRKLKSSVGFGAHESAYRIFLIPNADRMTTQAANSILKILEEPPPGWVFFLTASDPTLLLPTIVSRCQTIRLKPLSTSAVRELLTAAGVPADRRDICAELAQGSWSQGLSLAEEETWENRRSMFAFLQDPSASVGGLLDWATADPSHFDLLVNQLEQITSDLIRWSLTTESPDRYIWANIDGKVALAHHAKAMTRLRGGNAGARAFWLDRAERLAIVRQESLAPLNRKILTQDLLLPWLEASR